MRVAGRGYMDGVRNLEVMVESLSGAWSEEAGDSGRRDSYRAENFFLFKCSRRSWREANWVRLSATS